MAQKVNTATQQGSAFKYGTGTYYTAKPIQPPIPGKPAVKTATPVAAKQATKPTLPPWVQAVQNTYKLQNATVKDLQAKYGFDFSREYANRQAELERQQKQAAIQNQLAQLDQSARDINRQIDNDYFQRYMNLLQEQTNNGVNGGIAADQNLRLQMNRQNQLAQYMGQNRLQQDQLQAALASLPLEQQQRAEQMYQERLQQAFQNATKMDELSLQNLNNMSDYDMFMKNLDFERYKWNNLSADQREQQKLAYAQLELEKSKFKSEEEWRRYQYNNMSATDRALLDWEIQKYGKDLAWKMQETRMANDLEYYKVDAEAGLKAGLGGYDASTFLDW